MPFDFWWTSPPNSDADDLHLLGVPESERHWLFEAVEPGFDFRGSRKASIERLSVEDAGSRMYAYGSELLARKRVDPADDTLSIVATTRI